MATKQATGVITPEMAKIPAGPLEKKWTNYKDQILFVNKRADGSTEVYSLYDFKDFRENMDAEKGYLQGRFDAVPAVSTSTAVLKSFLGEVQHE